MEIINKASEKFKCFQDEICNPIFDILRKINTLEKEAMKRDREIEKYKEENEIDESEYTPEEEELYDYICDEMSKIVTPANFSDKLLKRGYNISYPEPQTYGYIDEECEAVFSMKSAERATVEIRDTAKISRQYKFVCRLIDSVWLLDEVYWRIDPNDDWMPKGIK